MGKTIILDFGSGNTCKNDKLYIKKMYDELKKIDLNNNKKIVIKWQLFKCAGENIPLTHDSFRFAYNYGVGLGYDVTASIFDMDSLKFLLTENKFLPFIKIANNRELDYLIDEIPGYIPVYVSNNYCVTTYNRKMSYDKSFFCVSKYPTYIEKYEKLPLFHSCCISDHTTNFELYYKYCPEIIEWHYKLKDSTGLDTGAFARTPEQLKEVLFFTNEREL
jgi:hypothetical protein